MNTLKSKNVFFCGNNFFMLSNFRKKTIEEFLLSGQKVTLIARSDGFERDFSNNKNLKIKFSAANGREVEFYSSMIFSIEVKIKSKLKNFISGGRYDQLTGNLGFRKVSAVGAAVNMNLYD